MTNPPATHYSSPSINTITSSSQTLAPLLLLQILIPSLLLRSPPLHLPSIDPRHPPSPQLQSSFPASRPLPRETISMGMELEMRGNNLSEQEIWVVVRSWTVRALASVSKGDSAKYDKLLADLSDVRVGDPSSEASLQFRLKALSQAVSFIDKNDHEALLSLVLGMSLWMHGLEVADALIEFVINLATANGGCVAQCLDMLVRNFLPPSCGLPLFIDSLSRRALMKGLSKEMLMRQKEKHIAQKDDVLQRVHLAIGRIAELVPMTAFHLQPIILQRMPHRIVDKEWNALYLENMLHLENYFAGRHIGTQMMMAIVDRLIEIDVEIRWEDIVREDDSNKVFVFDMDLDDDFEENDVGAGSLDPSGPGSEAKPQLGLPAKAGRGKKQSLGAVADKMDLLMDMTLGHLQRCAVNGRVAQVFEALMKSFQSTILDTYKSKFTQFLIFYLCSLAPTTCGAKFASLLWDIFTSTNRARNTRMSAAAYLASYLARAKFLPLSVVASSLKRLAEWCVAYLPRQNDQKSGLIVDAGVNGVFFSACQAVMYVLCFRMKNLMDDPEQFSMLQKLPLKQIIDHSLNPVKLCLPSVVEEFLKQATTAQLVDSRFTFEVNKKVELQVSSTFGGVNRLDMFFPFDPYLLRQSDRFIRPIFIFWSMVQFQEEGDVSDVEDEGAHAGKEAHVGGILDNSKEDRLRSSNLDIDRVTDERMGNKVEIYGSYCSEDDVVDVSMNRMSITPGDTTFSIPTALPAKLLPLPPKLSAYQNALLL